MRIHFFFFWLYSNALLKWRSASTSPPSSPWRVVFCQPPHRRDVWGPPYLPRWLCHRIFTSWIVAELPSCCRRAGTRMWRPAAAPPLSLPWGVARSERLPETTSLHLGNIVIRDDTTLAALGRELIAVNVPSCVCNTEDGREAEETQSRAPSPCVAPAASAVATASPLPTTATRTNNFVKVSDTSAVQAEKSAMVVSVSRVSHERNFHESLRGSGYVIVE